MKNDMKLKCSSDLFMFYIERLQKEKTEICEDEAATVERTNLNSRTPVQCKCFRFLERERFL